ncbi:uncharacterized protein [Montipora capricornis]|uniref:uncharacterized protein isoform X3 n=1 Tax=Montipora capricornis TaxID=246305 RepID=UPI0035F15F4B
MTVAGMRQIPSPEKFQLHISERGAKFVEQIEVNEGKGAAYFQVPPHNGLSETDDMYDFKINITVSRVKKDRACYISPLPPDLPRPNVLSKGLKKVSKLPPNHNISTTRQQWIVAGTVDKRTLRKEVQDFCGQFSIYRLKPYVPYSVSVVASDEGQSHAESDEVGQGNFHFVPTVSPVSSRFVGVPLQDCHLSLCVLCVMQTG